MIEALENNNLIKLHSAKELSEWFLAWASEKPDSQMTALKVQKLLYYAQGHHLALFNRPIFPEKIVAWEHGPVELGVYYFYQNKTKEYPIIKLENDFDFNNFTSQENDFLISIWNTYGKYDGSELERRTHNEKPWIENYYSDNRRTQEIPQAELKKFFSTTV